MTLQTPQEQLSADLDNAFYAAGMPGVTTATYTPAGGSGSAVTVILTRGDIDELPGADDPGVTATVRVRVDDVAAAAAGDTVDIDGDTWEVTFPELSADGLEWILTVHQR